MAYHFTKATVQSEIFCSKCMKLTPWRIADGRRQYCLICYARGAEKKPQAREKVETGNLFEAR